MQSRWLRAPLLVSGLFFLGACGNGAECVIDSDCADFSQVCLEQKCVPPGTTLDGGGASDAGPQADGGAKPDAGSSDAGATVDASMMSDAGPEPDGGPMPDGGAPMCTDITGAWAISTILVTPCGSAMPGYAFSVSAGSSACEFTFASADGSTPSLDGTASLNASDQLSGSLSTGGAAAVDCTGSLSGSQLTVSCGGCVMQAARM